MILMLVGHGAKDGLMPGTKAITTNGGENVQDCSFLSEPSFDYC